MGLILILCPREMPCLIYFIIYYLIFTSKRNLEQSEHMDVLYIFVVKTCIHNKRHANNIVICNCVCIMTQWLYAQKDSRNANEIKEQVLSALPASISYYICYIDGWDKRHSYIFWIENTRTHCYILNCVYTIFGCIFIRSAMKSYSWMYVLHVFPILYLLV